MAFNSAHFARIPEAKKSHTLFKRPAVHAGTMMHGMIVPAYCKLCHPGEVITEHIVGNIRMFPLGPIYSSNKIAFNAFFIPLRLLWEHWEEFFGENKSYAGPTNYNYKIPTCNLNNNIAGNRVMLYSVSHYLGKPLFKGSSIDNASAQDTLISCLKERAFWLTYSEWYRHEQAMNPVLLNKGNNTYTDGIGSLDGVQLQFSTICPQCLKDFDYFTTMTRSPQYGPDVVLPLGTDAPLKVGTMYDVGGDIKFDTLVSTTPGSGYHNDLALEGANGSLSKKQGAIANGTNNYSPLVKTNLYADLSNATSATIDELYLSMAAQAWYHNANYGSRHFEALQIHYGVYNPDLVLQRPEHIGEAKRFLTNQQIIASATTTNGGTTTKLGTPGAYSSTNIDVKFPRYACGEWGFYMVLMNTYHERYYPAGVLREDTYSDLFDFFFPEFSNIGDMGVFEKEIFYTSGTDQKKIIGFQEAWSEMRYTPNRLSGELDPYLSSDNTRSGFNNAPLSQWTFGEKWANAPTFSKQFLLEDREAFKNASINGANGPDYVFYLYFDEKTLSEVPLFSRPGLPGRGRGL